MNKTFLIISSPSLIDDLFQKVIWQMEIISPTLNDASLWNTEFRNQSLRAAIKEFLLTEEGKKIAKDNGDDFNWGDAMLHVPNKIWEKHGLKFNGQLEEETIFNVDHDENFVPQV